MANPITKFFLDDEELELSSNDDRISRYTQQMRLAAINKFTENGLPEDRDDLKTLLTALKDMDSTAATNKRLLMERDDSDASREVLEIVRRMHERNRHGMGADHPVRDDIPEPDISDMPPIEYDVGQLEVGLVIDSSKEFTARMRGDDPNDNTDE